MFQSKLGSGIVVPPHSVYPIWQHFTILFDERKASILKCPRAANLFDSEIATNILFRSAVPNTHSTNSISEREMKVVN